MYNTNKDQAAGAGTKSLYETLQAQSLPSSTRPVFKIGMGDNDYDTVKTNRNFYITAESSNVSMEAAYLLQSGTSITRSEIEQRLVTNDENFTRQTIQSLFQEENNKKQQNLTNALWQKRKVKILTDIEEKKTILKQLLQLIHCHEEPKISAATSRIIAKVQKLSTQDSIPNITTALAEKDTIQQSSAQDSCGPTIAKERLKQLQERIEKKQKKMKQILAKYSDPFITRRHEARLKTKIAAMQDIMARMQKPHDPYRYPNAEVEQVIKLKCLIAELTEIIKIQQSCTQDSDPSIIEETEEKNTKSLSEIIEKKQKIKSALQFDRQNKEAQLTRKKLELEAEKATLERQELELSQSKIKLINIKADLQCAKQTLSTATLKLINKKAELQFATQERIKIRLQWQVSDLEQMTQNLEQSVAVLAEVTTELEQNVDELAEMAENSEQNVAELELCKTKLEKNVDALASREAETESSIKQLEQLRKLSDYRHGKTSEERKEDGKAKIIAKLIATAAWTIAKLEKTAEEYMCNKAFISTLYPQTAPQARKGLAL